MTTQGERELDGFGLDGTVSVVIGASEGIGQAIAVGLARAGSAVVVAARSKERLAGVVESVQTRGGVAHGEEVDARDPDAIDAFAHTVVDNHGTPRVLVNSMGGTLIKDALDVAADEWDVIHETHLRGSFLLCKAFAPAMSEQGYGKMINLASTWAFAVARGRSAYASAKAGLRHLTAALALEWGPLGIRVNALAPTTTRTPRVREFLKTHPERESELMEQIPLGRLAEPEDVVGPAIFLASPLSDFVTGQTILVDGGWAVAK